MLIIIIGIAGDGAFHDIVRKNLQHVYTRSVRVIVCSVQIGKINYCLAIVINFLQCILVIDIVIRPYKGYLRVLSRELIPQAGQFGGNKVIYQN
jgi:hypothetical protein